MPGPGRPIRPGEMIALKFGTPEARRELCRQYFAHCQAGRSDRSFPFCDIKTLKRYAENYPEDFPEEIMEAAQRARFYFWEQIGIEGTIGNLPHFKPASWRLNMANRFGWSERASLEVDDKREKTDEEKRQILLERLNIQTETVKQEA